MAVSRRPRAAAAAATDSPRADTPSRKRKARDEEEEQEAEAPALTSPTRANEEEAVAAPSRALSVARKRKRSDYVSVPTLPTATGVIFSTGANMTGELGVDPDDVSDRWKPGPVRTLDDKEIVLVDVGGMHTAAISKSGQLYTWGCNDEKALGRSGPEFEPALVEGVEECKFVRVACSDSATFAIDSEGVLYGCGTFRDADGVLGFAPSVKFQIKMEPLASVSHLRFAALAAGTNHVCALSTDGRVHTFGAGKRQQFFNVSLDSSAAERDKVIMEVPSPLGRLVLARARAREATLLPQPIYLRSRGHPVAVFSGSFTSFAIMSNGHVFGWGLNKDGQLGLGHTRDMDEPTRIPALDGLEVAEIAAGDFHTLCLTKSGEVYAMGMNQYGQLGIGHTEKGADGSVKPITVPTLVTLDGPAKLVACGTQHSMCVTQDGRLFVWGTGSVGQLGLGENDDDESTDLFVPTLLPTKNRRVLAADAGAQFTVILATEKD